LIENGYRLKLLNMAADTQHYQIALSGLEGAVLLGNTSLTAPPGHQAEILMRVQIEPNKLLAAQVPIEFVIASGDQTIRVVEETRFMGPRQ